MGVALLALFSALGQAPASGQGSDQRKAAVDAALRSCVRQSAAAALGRPPSEAEKALLSDEALTDVRALVDKFRVLDEGEGGGLRFASVEADVSLARLTRRLRPPGEAVRTTWTREVGPSAEVRGAGRTAIWVRLLGDVRLGERVVGSVDETAWGFGSTAEEALADADARASQRAQSAARRHAVAGLPGSPALVELALRGAGRPTLALPLCATLAGRVPGVLNARLLRAGAGRAEIAIETTLALEDLARAFDSIEVAGRSLLAESTADGRLEARWVER